MSHQYVSSKCLIKMSYQMSYQMYHLYFQFEIQLSIRILSLHPRERQCFEDWEENYD